MPRRRGGVKFQIRRAIARQCSKSGQKRGNNKKILISFIKKYLIKTPAVGKAVHQLASSRPNICIVSSVAIRKTLYIVDPKSPFPLARLVGTNRYISTEKYCSQLYESSSEASTGPPFSPSPDSISEASSESRPSTPTDTSLEKSIEIITLD